MKPNFLLSSLSLLLPLPAVFSTSACSKDDSGVVEIAGRDKDDDTGSADAGPKKKPKKGAAKSDDDDTGDDDTGDDDTGDDDTGDDDTGDDDTGDDDTGDDDTGDDDTGDDDTGDDDTVEFGGDDDSTVVEPSPSTGAGGESSASGGGGGSSAGPSSGGAQNVAGAPVVATGCGANVVDDFSSCDTDICEHEGRLGVWFTFAGDGIGLAEDQDGVRYPTSDWTDETCAVMLAGGELEGETEFYAGVGFALNDDDPYDLSGYTGVRFVIETSALVDFTVRTAADEYFINASPAGDTAGSEEFTVPFATMIPRGDTLDENPAAELNLTLVKEFQWTVRAPESGFGMALHRVELY